MHCIEYNLHLVVQMSYHYKHNYAKYTVMQPKPLSPAQKIAAIKTISIPLRSV
jgi:hypothetical protein